VDIRRTHRLLLLASAFLLGCATGAAEPVLGPGMRVRARMTDGDRIVGSIQRVARDTLQIVGTDGETRAVSLASVSSVELSRGRGASTRTGVALGALAGGVIGGTVAVVSWEEPACRNTPVLDGTWNSCGVGWISQDSSAEGAAVGGAFLGALIGAGVGALIGSRVQAEQWQSCVPGPGPRASSLPACRLSGF
jgi:hypothetical protein